MEEMVPLIEAIFISEMWAPTTFEWVSGFLSPIDGLING